MQRLRQWPQFDPAFDGRLLVRREAALQILHLCEPRRRSFSDCARQLRELRPWLASRPLQLVATADGNSLGGDRGHLTEPSGFRRSLAVKLEADDRARPAAV